MRSAVEIELANAQERADSVAVLFAEKSPPPLSGESLRAYRCRLSDNTRFSPEISKVDLSAIPDDAAFQGMKIVCTPMQPKRANGRTQRLANCAWCPNERQADTLNTFYGDISAWLDPLSGRRQYVTRINPKGHSTD